MDYIKTITQKGQLLIPKEIRQYLGVELNGKIQISIKNGVVVLRKPAKKINEFAATVVKNESNDELDNSIFTEESSIADNSKTNKIKLTKTKSIANYELHEDYDSEKVIRSVNNDKDKLNSENISIKTDNSEKSNITQAGKAELELNTSNNKTSQVSLKDTDKKEVFL